MKKFLKNFPIETYVLFLPSVIFLLMMSVYVFFRQTGFVNQFFHGHFLALILGNDIFPVIYIIFFVGIIEVLIMINDQAKDAEIISFIKSACFLFGIFFISGLAITVAIQILFNIATPINTAANSVMFTKWDYAIFKTYPWLSLHHFINSYYLEVFIYESYLLSVTIMLILLVVLAFKNVFLLRKLLLSYFIVFIIAMPFWYIFPALAPDMMYRLNILHVPIASEVQKKLNDTNISKTSQFFLLIIEKDWIDNNNQSLPITTFPSMHAAWGILTTVIGIEFWAPLAFILIPWLLLELTGTLFTMEHYAVDVIFGIILGFIGIYIASYLLQIDKKKSFDKLNLFFSLSESRKIFSEIFLWIKVKWGRLSGRT